MTDAELVREIAEPLSGLNDYDRLLELIGDARFVLLGEATHGTHEFYSERAAITKRLIADKVVERMPDTLKHIERYAADAMDIRNTLVAKMQQLTPSQFEGLLRPAFQQDEWILIAVGAALGFLVGELQVFIMLHH